MRIKRSTLTDELIFCEQIQNIPRKVSNPIIINYDQVIQKQSQIIQSLYKQCTALRQKVNRLNSESIFSSQYKSLHQNSMEKFAEMIEANLLKEIASLLEITENQITKHKILQLIKRLMWERQKRSEPIFIERKKEVRIPVPVEVIVEKVVQKVIIQQKIIVQQKMVQVPVFRQKIVEKFIPKVQENLQLSNCQLSSRGKEQPSLNETQISQHRQQLQSHHLIKQVSKQEDNFILQKNNTINNFRSDQNYQNKNYYSKNYQNNINQYKRTTKNYIKNVLYSPLEYQDYKKIDYTNDDQYNHQKRNDYDYKKSTQHNSYYRYSYADKKNFNPSRIYQQKYQDQQENYKNKPADPSQRYNKNTKRKDKYSFNDRYNE